MKPLLSEICKHIHGYKAFIHFWRKVCLSKGTLDLRNILYLSYRGKNLTAHYTFENYTHFWKKHPRVSSCKQKWNSKTGLVDLLNMYVYNKRLSAKVPILTDIYRCFIQAQHAAILSFIISHCLLLLHLNRRRR